MRTCRSTSMSFCQEANCVSRWRKRTRVSPSSSASNATSLFRSASMNAKGIGVPSSLTTAPPDPSPQTRPPGQVGSLLGVGPARKRDGATPEAGVGFPPRPPRANQQRQPLGGLVLRSGGALQQQIDDQRHAGERGEPDGDVQGASPGIVTGPEAPRIVSSLWIER